MLIVVVLSIMTEYQPSELITLIAALISLEIGAIIQSKVKVFNQLAIPSPIIGGILVAILLALADSWFGIRISFATGLRDILILVFFVTLGLTAKLKSLRSGGKPLLIICLVTILLLVLQNIAGIAVAVVNGSHPFYGLLAGSASFVGGPGTALAWAKEAAAVGLKHTELVAISAATFAVSVGAFVSGPFVAWMVRRHNLSGELVRDEEKLVEEAKQKETVYHPMLVLRSILLISIAVLIGTLLNEYASEHGLLLPGFLCSLLAGMLLVNLGELKNISFPVQVNERLGDLSLQLFLAISMMSLKLVSISSILLPLAIFVTLQVILTCAIGYFVLFRKLGRDYDAAVTTGGFIGFAISSMPVAMATMDNISRKFGPSPKAVLLITLAGSFFVDLANSFIVKGFVTLLPLISP